MSPSISIGMHVRVIDLELVKKLYPNVTYEVQLAYRGRHIITGL